MELRLRDKVVVVTGATSGIGRAVTEVLADEGCRIALGSRDPDAVEATVDALIQRGSEAVGVPGDLSSRQGIDGLVDAAVSTFGAVDGLVTSVGSTPLGSPDELTEDDWAQAFEMKFLATLRAIEATVPHLRRRGGGRIVAIAGNSAHDPAPGMATSAVINAALGSLTSVYARHLAAERIGVVAVNPGPVRTPRFDGLVSSIMRSRGLDRGAAEAQVLAAIPDGRAAEAPDIAHIVALLLSDRSAHLTGVPITIDGAQTWPR